MHGLRNPETRERPLPGAAPLKIAIPIHALEPGGVERVALALAAEWQGAGHEVTIVLGRADCAQLCSAPALDYWHIPTRHSTRSWETVWMIYCLSTYLVENQADVLFCPGNTYAVLAPAMKVLLGEHTPPSVLKVSNALHRPDMPAWMQAAYRVWLRAQGATFDRLIGLSEPMAREIRHTTHADPDAIAVIANPVLDQRRLRRLRRIARKAPAPGSLAFLTAGRLVRQKNFPMMLRAFARVARPHDTLTIAGDGPERAALEALARELGLAAQVRFAGHRASIDPLLARADAFLLSSDYEGLPGVVVEALAAGLPVLATDCCVSMVCLLETERTGLLVPVGDEARFAQGLVRLRELGGDPARARAIAAGYAVETAAERYVDVMHHLVRQHRLACRTVPLRAQWQRTAFQNGLT